MRRNNNVMKAHTVRQDSGQYFSKSFQKLYENAHDSDIAQ